MKECEQCNALRHQRALGHQKCDREDGVWIPRPGEELWGGESSVFTLWLGSDTIYKGVSLAVTWSGKTRKWSQAAVLTWPC